MMRAVVDTNVIFEGLTQNSGANFEIVRAWRYGLFIAFCCDTVSYEYYDVFYRKLSKARWDTTKPILSDLVKRADWQKINYRWRPISPDPGDDHVIECALNANASIVTLNIRDFKRASLQTGLLIFTPAQFLMQLAE